MCHRYSRNPDTDRYDDGDVPNVDTNPFQDSPSADETATHAGSLSHHDADYYQNVEPLPESSRPRQDGPGGS